MARLFVIPCDGRIPEMGGIRGPITSPIEIPIDKVISMMNRGVIVEEVNPYKKSERVRMTFSNIHTNTFVKPVKAAPVVQAAAAPQIPVGRSNVVVDASNEAKAAKETRDNKSWKNNKKDVTPVTKSDF